MMPHAMVTENPFRINNNNNNNNKYYYIINTQEPWQLSRYND
jgi:hypothetical protein